MPSHLDPLAGDFDEELGSLDPADVQVVQPSREHHLIVQFTLEGDDTVALQRIAEDEGERPSELGGKDFETLSRDPVPVYPCLSNLHVGRDSHGRKVRPYRLLRG